MIPKPPRESKELSWPYEPRAQPPKCLKPSSFDLKPPWRPVCLKSADFEPKCRLLCSSEPGANRNIRVCRQERYLQSLVRPESAASAGAASGREPLHCDCLSHWNSLNSRPSSAPAGGGVDRGAGRSKPKKRPAWRPAAAQPAAFDPSPGLLCDPGPPLKLQISPRAKRVCQTCGLRAKPSPVLRNLMNRIENLMSEAPFGWCTVNPTPQQRFECNWHECSAIQR